jgi:Putative SAM-dependent methyltransferase
MDVDVIDSCPGWEPILSKLTVAANESLNTVAVTFHHADIVMDHEALSELLSTANFVTMMFTLNELITTHGKVAATKFLVTLIKRIPSGSLILVLTAPA